MAQYDQFWRPASDPGGYYGGRSIRQLIESPAYATFGWRGPLRTGDERPPNSVVAQAQRVFHPGSGVSLDLPISQAQNPVVETSSSPLVIGIILVAAALLLFR